MVTKSLFLALLLAAPLQAALFAPQPAPTAAEAEYKAWMQTLEDQLKSEAGSSTVDASSASVKKLLSSPGFTLALYQWKLLRSTGPENLKTLITKDSGVFLKWLLSNSSALEGYLASGPLDKEGTAHGLEIWQSILAADPAAREGLWSRVAIATALSHTIPVKALADGREIDPLARYQHFKKAHEAKTLYPCFDQEAVWELRFVMNAWAHDEELDWVTAQVTDEKRNNQAHIGDACWMVPYRGFNAKGVSVQDGSRYYDYLPVTLQLMHEVGGVCGAISKFGTNAVQAHGVPAMPVGQPGHCAFLWKDTLTTWRTGNDIEGWAGSSEHGGIHIHWGNRGSYVLLMEEAHRDPARFTAADQACWLAELIAGKDAKKSAAFLQTP